MSGLATGIMVAGGIGAAGSIIGGILGSNAASSAAQAQEAALAQANQTQINTILANAGLQTPGRNLGYGADALLAQLYGLPNPNAPSTTNMYDANSALAPFGGLPGTISGTPGGGTGGSPGGMGLVAGAGGGVNTGAGGPVAPGSTGSNAPAGNWTDQFSNFFNSPGYQFTLGQGEQAINRGASANGNLYSTNTLGALDKFAQGTASQQYNNYVSQLMNLANLGGTATNNTGQAITSGGNNISSNQISAGNANASGILGSAGAWTGAVNNASNLISNAAIFGNYNPGTGGAGVGGGGSAIPNPGAAFTYNPSLLSGMPNTAIMPNS